MNDITAKILRGVNTVVLKAMMSNKPGRKFFHYLAEDYIAGHSLEEGLETIKEYYLKNMYSTYNILGEAAITVEQSDRCIEAYYKMTDMLAETFKDEKPANISVKPTVISSVDEETATIINPETPLEERLEKVVKYADDKGIEITLDMEDHPWTDISLETAQNIWNKGLKMGIVLQSRLNRTKDDIKKVLMDTEYKIPKKDIRVRACIGIYIEPKEMATNNKTKAKARLVERISELFDAGVYVEIGTHDKKVIYRIINEIIKPRNISNDRFEFQFLKGVQVAYKLVPELHKEGYKTRFYVPTELADGDGIPYMIRRLIANPGMLLSGAKNFFQVIFK